METDTYWRDSVSNRQQPTCVEIEGTMRQFAMYMSEKPTDAIRFMTKADTPQAITLWRPSYGRSISIAVM